MAKEKVLLIEDEKSVTEIIGEMLAVLGFQVAGIESRGKAAINRLVALQPDVVLMDIRLRGNMDGIQTAQEIYKVLDIPVIYLTGASDDETIRRAKTTAPYGYLIKPVNIDELRVTIEMALHKHKLEQQLKRQEQWLSTTLRSIGDGVITTDNNNHITLFNHAAEQITGWDAQAALGNDISTVLNITSEDTPIDFSSDFQSMLAANGNAPSNSLQLITRDETKIPIEINSSPLQESDGKTTGFVLVFRDISQRKEAEAQLLAYQERLRSLASTLSIIEERERQKIASQLHESIGQVLAMSKFKLASVLNMDLSTDAQKHLHEIYELIEQTVKETRLLTTEISPPVLYELGFKAGVSWLLERTEENNLINTILRDDGEEKTLDNDIRIILFRAISELINNVIKHADADQITVSLDRQGDYIEVQVQDDGQGFDVSTLSPTVDMQGGFGLFNIRERLEHVHGSFKIESTPGEGTLVTLKAPLTNQ